MISVSWLLLLLSLKHLISDPIHPFSTVSIFILSQFMRYFLFYCCFFKYFDSLIIFVRQQKKFPNKMCFIAKVNHSKVVIFLKYGGFFVLLATLICFLVNSPLSCSVISVMLVCFTTEPAIVAKH